jgi:uncharacterized protein (DUF934 family)
MEMLPNTILRQDPWTLLTDEDKPSLDTPFLIIPWNLIADTNPDDDLPPIERGVLFPNHLDVHLLSRFLSSEVFSLVALEFPVFNDGRAYSQAHTLRTQLQFSKTLRAYGNILPDQVAFMRRCGFDSLIINEQRFPLDTWKEALSSFSAVYQKDSLSAPDLPASILEKRQAQNIS